MEQAANVSHLSLPDSKREHLINDLNTLLATTIDLEFQVKQAHWNTKGPQFFARHELFDKLAEPLRETADEIAERASTLGGYAQGTVRLTSLGSVLPEYDLTARNGKEHIQTLSARYGTFTDELRRFVKRANQLDDPVTADLYVETLRKAELGMWFLQNHLIGSE
jgi:starvation-inducible DNA-binding protein